MSSEIGEARKSPVSIHEKSKALEGAGWIGVKMLVSEEPCGMSD